MASQWLSGKESACQCRPGDLPNPGTEPFPVSLALQVGSLPFEPPGNPLVLKIIISLIDAKDSSLLVEFALSRIL